MHTLMRRYGMWYVLMYRILEILEAKRFFAPKIEETVSDKIAAVIDRYLDSKDHHFRWMGRSACGK